MTGGPARIEPFGDAALLITLGDIVDLELNRRVHALAADLRDPDRSARGLGPPVPSYASVLVPYDPERLDPSTAAALVAPLVETALARRLPELAEAGWVDVPTRYGGADGPDLDEVAERHGLRPAEVVELHAATEYRVFLVGFVPGFAYLGPLDAAIATPRRATPRERVPAGSVGIAGDQTGIYPLDSPGGWQLIGRTELRPWDPARTPPALLRPGMRVRFVPVADG